MARDKEFKKLERAYMVTSAPGDATRYTFIVAEPEPVNGVRRLCFCPYDDGATVGDTHIIENNSVSELCFSCIHLDETPRQNLSRLSEMAKEKHWSLWSESYLCGKENPYTMLEVYRIAKLIFEGRESELA